MVLALGCFVNFGGFTSAGRQACGLATALNARVVFNMNLMQFVHDGGANLKALLEFSVRINCTIFAIEPTNEEPLPTGANLVLM